MADKQRLKCGQCGYETDVYSGNGFFNQHISNVVCLRCNTIQPLTVGGVIAEIAPSFGSEFGRLCPNCMSGEIRLWNGRTCPKCGGNMLPDGDKAFWC